MFSWNFNKYNNNTKNKLKAAHDVVLFWSANMNEKYLKKNPKYLKDHMHNKMLAY